MAGVGCGICKDPLSIQFSIQFYLLIIQILLKMTKQGQLKAGTSVNFTATPTNVMPTFTYSSTLILFFFIFPFVRNIYAQGTCLSYDNSNISVNQRTIISNSATLQLTDYTVEFWFFSTDNTRAILTRGLSRGANNARIFDVFGNGTNLRVALTDNTLSNVVVQDVSPYSALLNQWNHIAIIKNGSTLTTYLNGANPLNSSIAFTPNNSAYEWFIGGHGLSSPPNYRFNGRVDELRIWSTARTQSEIQQNMLKELTGSESNLVAYYNFNEGSGTTLTDLTTPQENGINSNSPTWVTSYVPMGNSTVQSQTDVRCLWQASGTNNTLESGGLFMKVGTQLTEPNYANFGHDNANGSLVGTDLTGTTAVSRYNRTWYNDEVGTVDNASITFDLGTITGTTVTPNAANDYVLLYRSGISGNFTEVAVGNSVANSDQITFTGINLQDGYYAIGSKSTVLSVEFTQFTATTEGSKNLLTWSTANELSNKGFQVERQQLTGDSWDVLGFKTANNKEGTYNFIDHNPLSTSYYRLRQIDNDGKETLSKVVSVSRSPSTKLKVYPNPVSNVLTVETDFVLAGNEANAFQIYNLLGQQVLHGKAPFGGWGLDVSALPKGTYFLKVGVAQVKFIKQ